LTASTDEPDADALLPDEISFELALAAPIDTASAAAGDVISAHLTEPIPGPQPGTVLAPAGSPVTGRIIRMEHHFFPTKYFLVSMAFDTLQVDDRFFRLHAKSGRSGGALNVPKDEDWPMGTFVFSAGDSRFVIPAGYTSLWRNTAPASTK
jgi:hypothetical protein